MGLANLNISADLEEWLRFTNYETTECVNFC